MLSAFLARSEHQDLKKSCESLTKRNHELEDQITVLESERNEYKRQVAELEQQMRQGMETAERTLFDEKNSLQKDLSDLKTRVAILDTEAASAKRDLVVAQSQLDQQHRNRKALQAELNQSKEKIESLQQEKQSLNDRIHQMMRESEAETDRFNRSLQKAQVGIDFLSHTLSKSISSCCLPKRCVAMGTAVS